MFVHLYLAFVWSPPEQHMGNLVRIMYFHVPSAWNAFFAFFVTFVCAILYLRRRRLVYDLVSAASAEIGVLFTSITLVTGSLWARPIWNTWWTWDPRLTTTLILWFLYAGYFLLRASIDGRERRARVSAVFAIVAFADVPVIHMSVEWWRSIHPLAVDETGFNMPGSMAATLMFGFVAFMCLYGLFLALRVRQQRQAMELHELREAVRAARVRQEGQV
ncbi:MAG: cytochrome c biogenesis protein CcsA [Alicyclobacillaceae bacterium]|nr:cytochrome c biogenesis protein CcsA [Alicyclobacillaceae bacterium]